MRQLLLMSPIFILLIGAWRIQSVRNELSQQTNQKVVDLSGQELKVIPDAYKERILEAEVLILDNNFITELPIWLKESTVLEKISVNNNPEFDLFQFTVDFQEMKQIKELSASGCNILSIPYQLTFLTKLKKLDLSDNLIKEIPYHFSFITSLEYCDLSDNRITDVGYSLRDLSKLKSLDLSGNNNLNIKDFSLSFEYRTIDFLSIEVKDTLPDQFSTIKCRQLNLGINDEFVPNGQLAGIETEQLTFNCQFKLPVPASVNKELSANNFISGLTFKNFSISTLPKEITGIHSLKTLDISGSELSSAVTLSSMNFLNELNISENDLNLEQIRQLKKDLPNCIINSDEEKLLGNKVSVTIAPPLKNSIVPEQRMTIDPENPENFISESGLTTLSIPKSAFLDEKGKIVTTPVDITFTEYNDAVDIALSGIPMQIKNADGSAGDFSSAGMFNFKATSNGKEVYPNPKALITASISSPQKTPYNLYEFKEGEGWNLLQDEAVIPAMTAYNNNELTALSPAEFDYSIYRELANLKIRMADTAILNRLAIYEPKIVMRHKKNNNAKSFTVDFDVLDMYSDPFDVFKHYYYEYPEEYTKMLRSDLVYNDYNYKSDAALMDSIKRDIRKNYYKKNKFRKWRKRKYSFKREENVILKDIMVMPDTKRDDFILKFNYRGKLHSFHVVLPEHANEAGKVQDQYKEYYQNYLFANRKKGEAYKKVLENYEKYYDNLEKEKRSMYKRLKKEFDQKMEAYEEQMKKNGLSFKEYEERLKRENNMMYTFQLASFGYTNCDVVNRMERPQRIKAFFKTVLGGTLIYLKMFRIDKKMNAISVVSPQDNVIIDYGHDQTALLLIMENDEIGIIDAKTLSNHRDDQEIKVKVVKTEELKPEKVRAML